MTEKIRQNWAINSRYGYTISGQHTLIDSWITIYGHSINYAETALGPAGTGGDQEAYIA